MHPDLKALFPKPLLEWQENLLDVLLNQSTSENQLRVTHLPRCPGKSWTKRWLSENVWHNWKLNERNYVPLPLTTKADISTLVPKNKPSISVVNERKPIVIYFDEMSYPVNNELVEKLNEITKRMKTSVAQTPKSEYNIYINRKEEKE